MDDATDAARLISKLRDDIQALEQASRQNAVVSLLRSVAVADVDSVTVSVEARTAANMTCGTSARSPAADSEIAFVEINDTT